MGTINGESQLTTPTSATSTAPSSTPTTTSRAPDINQSVLIPKINWGHTHGLKFRSFRGVCRLGRRLGIQTERIRYPKPILEQNENGRGFEPWMRPLRTSQARQVFSNEFESCTSSTLSSLRKDCVSFPSQKDDERGHTGR